MTRSPVILFFSICGICACILYLACGGPVASGGSCTWKGGKCEAAIVELETELERVDEIEVDPGSAPDGGADKYCHWDHGKRPHGGGPKYHCHTRKGK